MIICAFVPTDEWVAPRMILVYARIRFVRQIQLLSGDPSQT